MAAVQTQKPENVLKRAEEYVGVGKKDSALRTIFDMLSNKRGRAWSQAHEKVMLRYLELCIEVKNSRYAKDGLIQFRYISMNQAPGSMEKVIDQYLTTVKKLTEEAAAECNLVTISREVEDLENDASPESILLEAVTADKTRERTEREILVPWLKFLWDSYRLVIEILRGQPKFDDLYHSTARKAFGFCEQYSRTTEFRRLCQMLRTHLTPDSNRFDQVIVNTAETMSAHLETRFEQLRVASALRIWHEGFRTIEDIHFIMNSSELKSSSKLMGPYYDKLTQLFLVSENYLFHAYAFKKYYLLTKEKKKGVTKDTIRMLASAVVLAALSIPLQNAKAGTTVTDDNSHRDRNKRMAELLGFDFNPKREAILAEISELNIVKNSFDQVKQIYILLEEKFAPLELVQKITPLLGFLKGQSELSNYVKPIEQLLVIRLISQLSKIFNSVKLDYLKQLLSGLELSDVEIETTLIRAVKARQIGSLTVKIDHMNGCIFFGENLFEESRTKNMLVDLASGLERIWADQNQKSFDKWLIGQKEAATKSVANDSHSDHANLLKRKEIIEYRKEELEQKQVDKLKEAQEQQLALNEEKAREEKVRIQMQLEQKEREMEERLKKEEKLYHLKQEMLNAGVDLSGTEIADMTDKERENLLKRTQEKQKAAAAEADKKLIAASRKLDAMVRAHREQQIPRVKEIIRTLAEKQKVDHDAKNRALIENSEKQHGVALEIKARTKRMKIARSNFEESLLKLWKQQGQRELSMRIANVRKQQCLDKIDRARQRLRKENELKRKAEEERIRIAELEARRKVEEERRAKEEEERARQRQVEIRDTPEDEVWRRGPPASSRIDAPQPPPSDGPWRDVRKPPISAREGNESRPEQSNSPWARTSYPKSTPTPQVEAEDKSSSPWQRSSYPKNEESTRKDANTSNVWRRDAKPDAAPKEESSNAWRPSRNTMAESNAPPTNEAPRFNVRKDLGSNWRGNNESGQGDSNQSGSNPWRKNNQSTRRNNDGNETSDNSWRRK